MFRLRTGWRDRAQRAAALAATLAVAAVLAPAATATAATSDSSLVLLSGSEAAGATATYGFVCDLGTTTMTGVDWVLYNGSFTWDERERHSVTTFTTQTTTHREGTFTADFSALPPGSYQLRVECKQSNGYYPMDRFFTAAPLAAATTTTVAANPTEVLVGQSTTVTATVAGGAPGGVVAFFANGSLAGSALLVGGRASVTVPVPSATTFTATYQGTDGYAESTSTTGAAVSVVADVTAPATVAVSGPVSVGTPVFVDLGTWQPTGVLHHYVWKVAGTPVSADPIYTPTPADLGKALTVEVTGTHPDLPAGTAKTVTSTPVTVAPGTIVQGRLELDGTADGQAVLGQTLTPRPVGYGPDAVFSYEWFVGDNEFSVPGATYTPQAADLGKVVRARATVTAPGKTTVHDSAYAWAAVATPAVTVGSSTITVGRDAVVPVTVAGPKGAPVPTGDVQVTLTPRSGGTAVVRPATALNGSGKATVTVADLPVGTYDVTATYLPASSPMPVYAVASVGGSINPYLTATGRGTVTVTKVTPTVTLPGTVEVPVATRPAIDLTVGGTPLPREYRVVEGGTVLTQGPVGADGRVSVVLPVLTAGTHTLVLEIPATETTAAVTRTFTVTVGGEPARVGALPTATLDTPKAATAPGQQMELVAEGFNPGETVAFYLHSDPVFLGTAVAGADGVARLLADIPAGAPAGAHTVIATGGTSGRWATLAVELATPAGTPAATPAAAADPELAATGAQSGLVLAGAWVLLLTGAGLVLVARRVRAAH